MTALATEAFDINAIAANAANDALAAMPRDEATEADATPVVEATDLEEVPADADPAEAEAPAEGDEAPADEAALPEGYVAVPTVSEGLATDFALYDEQGEVEIPALVVEYKANGKVRKDRLDQVVKMAQMGVYNEERDKKAQFIEQEYQQSLAAVQQMQQLVEEREAQMERLLNDESFREAVYDAYLQENSPEKRAERAEQQVQQLYLQQQLQGISQQGEQFYTQEVMPALAMIGKALPTISEQELSDRMMMAMQAHADTLPTGDPYVPPSRYDAIRQYIVEDLALWAQAVHARRSQPVSDERQVVQMELEKARIEAQKAKNLVGRATKPTGQTVKPSAQGNAKALSTVDDATSEALRQALASFAS